ncbi:MAG: outer membrane beta-barrel protein [Dyadobacter sp.]|uniref:outer membrane beta-barrel protein n=1 Tax=Dyadobacter sp. TaxID=1914288 RepID=UPI0032647521
MKTFISILFSLFIIWTASAQNIENSISGAVRDTRNEVIPGATVKLLRAADSSMVLGEITDIDGKFRFKKVDPATYLISITAMGQKPFTSVSLTIDEAHPSVSMPPVILLPAKNIELNEVTIKTKKPLIVQEIDRTVLNVESMISSASSNTLEILGKTPGVSVSANGEISLNGKSGVMVLIDGRSTYMSGQDLAAYLKSLPGGVLDKIELIDNPPARYDAAGNAIIDIRLKKSRAGGLTGSVSFGASMGKYARNNDAINLNYNRKKVNLFANLGYNHEKNYSLDVYDRRFYTIDSKPSSFIDLVNHQTSRNNGFNANFGMDFAATPKTTYGLIVNLNGGKRTGTLDYESTNFNATHNLDAIGSGDNRAHDSRDNKGFNLNMLHKFNTTGRELAVDANYLRYHSQGSQTIRNTTFQPNGAVTGQEEFLYHIPSLINIYTAKADYSHPLKNKAKMDAGFKSSIVDNDIIFDHFNVNEGIQTIDNRRSNHFKYHENINAVYMNGQKSWSRLGVQLGVRVENTEARGNQIGNDSIPGIRFTKSYTGLFPSAFLSYKLDKKGNNTLVLMAVRRISRPNYQLLNPFVVFKDQYSYSSGNPMVTPQYQNRLELKYQHKQFLNMGLSYNKFTDVIFQTTQAVGEIFTTRPENIANGYMVLLNTTVSVSPTKWWYTNTTLRLSRMEIQGPVYTEQLSFETNIARLEVNNYFTMKNGWSAELGGYYASRDLNGQTVTSGMYRVNAGIQKKIWKGKGNISLSAEDIFHTWIYHNKSLSLRQSEYFQTSESDTQRVGLSISYRFGKDTFARKRRHNNNASDDEKGRIDQ